ncbi:MAG: sporulation protein, partial [Enterovirga sp.]|nr:sporulation protein [Enterovirga sp.]
MSEARHQRFEIDIDEIERELRRSAESAPAPRPDPLAELARIVGQDDPFRGIIGESRSGAPRVASDPAAAAGGGYGNLDFAPDDRLGSRDTSPQAGGYDPVADVYGSPDAALAEDDMQPLRPRRSRGKLAAVAATLLVTTGAIAGGLYWQRAGGGFSPSGAPPLITADRTPVKKPPENPGGMEVPNQDRQIYDQKPDDGRSRVVDGREQPIDVQEAVRSMPSTADRAPAVSARAPVTGPAMPVDTGERLAGTGQAAPAAPSNGSNAVTTALGEPRRVRTVAVRPDGSVYTPTTTSSIAAAQPSLLPGNSLPPPVPVATISVPA